MLDCGFDTQKKMARRREHIEAPRPRQGEASSERPSREALMPPHLQSCPPGWQASPGSRNGSSAAHSAGAAQHPAPPPAAAGQW